MKRTKRGQIKGEKKKTEKKRKEKKCINDQRNVNTNVIYRAIKEKKRKK